MIPAPRKCVVCAGSGVDHQNDGWRCKECNGTGVFRPKPRVVYVAGPFRARTPWEVEQRVRRAEEASVLLWQAGVINLCPHTQGRFTNGLFDDDILAGMLELASRCDAILLLSGWENSAGSRAEAALMESLHKKIFECSRSRVLEVVVQSVAEWVRQSAP